MSRNPYTDGEPFSVTGLNSQKHAHALEVVLQGCELSTGAGSFEVDVAAGSILNSGQIDVAADTVDHVGSDTEDRVDLVTADTAGNVSITSGTPATTSGQPVAPDIPADEVLLGAVLVRGGSSEIVGSDIFDEYRTVRTQGEGTGLDADLLRGEDDSYYFNPDNMGEGSGLDADTIREVQPFSVGSGSDITRYANTTGSTSFQTVFDLTGTGVVLTGLLNTESGNSSARLIIDGSSISLSASGVDGNNRWGSIPVARFESSAKYEIRVTTSGPEIHGMAWVWQ